MSTSITIRDSDIDLDGYYAAGNNLMCDSLTCEISVKFRGNLNVGGDIEVLGDIYVLGHLDVRGQKMSQLRQFVGLYRYRVWAALMADGTHWVRMGCLWKSLDEWDRIGIRQSNLDEFPDDGSELSEGRVLAFEFAKAAALRMKLPKEEK